MPQSLDQDPVVWEGSAQGFQVWRFQEKGTSPNCWIQMFEGVQILDLRLAAFTNSAPPPPLGMAKYNCGYGLIADLLLCKQNLQFCRCD